MASVKASRIRVGIATFTDPRDTAGTLQREKYNNRCHRDLKRFLRERGFQPVDAMADLRPQWSSSKGNFGLGRTDEVFRAADFLNANRIDCLVIGAWHWTDSFLPVRLQIHTDVPTALFCMDDPAWGGTVFISAVSASMKETAAGSHALTNRRFKEDWDGLAQWIRGVGALQQMRRASALLWGGTYSLRMEHLQDDIPHLKSFIIGDILQEDQIFLAYRADDILSSKPKRIDKMLDWLKSNNATIKYDDKMATPEVVRRQMALYLAARDRLDELKEEEPIEGVSIKCQPALSELWGTTACSLPAFLPFACDGERKRRDLIPTVCEGDIKGLLTGMLLNKIQPGVPPLFGDVRYIGADFWVISNCGASSVYFAANTLDPAEALSKVTIQGQCQGASGAAFGYFGKPCTLTLARLTRVAGEYSMQLGLGRVVPFDAATLESLGFGSMWPLHKITMDSDMKLFFDVVGANHFSATVGDVSQSVEAACYEAGIRVVRVDDDGDLLEERNRTIE